MLFFQFLIAAAYISSACAFSVISRSVSPLSLRMGLDPVLSKSFPRDFKNIPFGTEYGSGTDETKNKEVEARRLKYLEDDLFALLKVFDVYLLNT